MPCGAAYTLNGEAAIFTWMAESDAEVEERLAVIDWLPRLAGDPEGAAKARRNRPGVPAMTAKVPGTDVWIDYTISDQFHTVLITGVTTFRL